MAERKITMYDVLREEILDHVKGFAIVLSQGCHAIRKPQIALT
jgi:hypothetical protein